MRIGWDFFPILDAMVTVMNQRGGSPMVQSTYVCVVRQGDALVVRPSGPRLGEREANAIAAKVRHAVTGLGGGLCRLVLDLSQVQIMSSFGLGLCIELRNHAHFRGACTVLANASPDLRELFRIMKVDRLFTIALGTTELPATAA